MKAATTLIILALCASCSSSTLKTLFPNTTAAFTAQRSVYLSGGEFRDGQDVVGGLRATGSVGYKSLDVKLENNSRVPLTLNYYADKWMVLSTSEGGTLFEATCGIVMYPTWASPLQPGESAEFHLNLPESCDWRTVNTVVVGFGLSDVVVRLITPDLRN